MIASSYEVLCGLTLSDKEMHEYHNIMVQEVLEVLQKNSLDEIRLILKTHEETKAPLTEISEKVSAKINLYTYQLLDYLTGIQLPNNPDDPYMQCFLAHCLPFLKENFTDRLLRDIPDIHKKAMIASHLACRVVYKRGLDWSPTLVGILPLLLSEPEI